jgi:hypothetical protein
MIMQVMMSPAVALHHWAVNNMSIAKVLSHTGYTTVGALYEQYLEDLENRLAAMEDKYMSPDERQAEEDRDTVWDEFGDYIREFVPPAEYDDEIERLLPLIAATRLLKSEAASKRFRDAVRRRKARLLQ